MALVFDQNVPTGIVDAARKALGELATTPDSRGGGQGLLSQAILSDLPLPVYSIRLDALARITDSREIPLAQASPEGWRIFVMDPHQEPIGVADVAPALGTHEARFLSYTQGPRIDSAGQVLTSAAVDLPLRDRQLQPAFLDIPGLHVSAVWFKALDGQGDAVVVTEPVPRFLKDQPIYTLDEFLDRTRPRATQRLQMDNSPRGNNSVLPLASS